MADTDESSYADCAVSDERTQPASQQPEQLKPLSQLTKGRVWRHVTVQANCVTVRGGFNATFDMAPSVSYTTGKKKHNWVQLSKNATWFLKGVGGKSVRKGDLKAVNVLNVIRKRFHNAAGIEDITAVVEDEDAEEPKESCSDDSMDALEEIAPQVTPARATAYAQVLPQCKSKAESFQVPKHPACSGWKEDNPNGQTEIHVYKHQKTNAKQNHTCMYLRSDCIAWLLQYAADELLFQGSERENEQVTEEEQLQCNYPEVAGVHMEWDFTVKKWTATFVAGEYAGTAKCFSAADLNRAHWKKMIALSLVDSQSDDVKKVIERFMIHWCQAILRRTGDAFEAEWGLGKAFETPKKKPRLHVA